MFDSAPTVPTSAPAPQAFQPINLFGDPMGGSAPVQAPEEDAFGELFDTTAKATTAAANLAILDIGVS